MIGREEHVGVGVPAALARASRRTRPHASSISSFSTWIIAFDLAQLIVGVSAAGANVDRAAFGVLEAPPYQSSQWRGFCARIAAMLLARPRMAGRKRSRSRQSTRASHLVERRIEGMMRIGKAHPAEEGIASVRASRARRSCARRPSRCGSARAGSGCASPPARRSRRRRAPVSTAREAGDVVGMALAAATARSGARRAARASRARRARSRATARASAPREAVLFELQRADRGADRSAPCRSAPCDSRRAAEITRDVRRVGRQRHAVGDDAVRARILSREHRRRARHADDVLHVGPPVVEASDGEPVDDRRPRDVLAVQPSAS